MLSVTATGDDLAAARAAVYAKVKQISFEGAQYRSDIAAKAEANEITIGLNAPDA